MLDEYQGGQESAWYSLGGSRRARLSVEGVRHYHADGLGSLRALSDATGQKTDSYAYQAFGEIASRTGNSTNAFLFAGEKRDEDLGMDYLRARWMVPGWGG